jgi:Fe-S cluster assembly protein SufD
MQTLNINNLPTPKDERWKYTNLPRAVPEGLTQQDTQVIEITDNTDFTINGENGTIHAPQIKIMAGQGKEITVIERHTGQGEYWKNAVTKITLAPNAKINHIRLVEDTSESLNTNMVSIHAGRDSVYNGFCLNMGGKLTRHEIHAIMSGSNAEISFNGLNLLGGTQHGDTTILIEHAAPHCRSNQFYRTLLDGQSRGVFQGKVHVHQIAQKTDGYQLSNAILLSDKAEMDTKPELEIYADDVKCSHGATTGQLDEEPLFYLRSRGLTDAQARTLLLEAFIAEVIEKVNNDDLEQQIAEKAQSWLIQTLS